MVKHDLLTVVYPDSLGFKVVMLFGGLVLVVVICVRNSADVESQEGFFSLPGCQPRTVTASLFAK